jgi:hypothetical protein
MPNHSTDGRWRVFLSSTFRELKTYRSAVRERCAQELNDWIDLVALDDGEYAKVAMDPKVLSVEKVKTCDLVVLLMGPGLGSRTATGESFTEAEIRTAQENGIRVKGFVLNENARGIPANPSQEDRRRWEKERVQLLSAAVGKRDELVGLPKVSLRTPAQLADQVVRVLHEWLDLDARPHSLRGTGQPDVVFVDREDPYRKLKSRVLGELDSVVSGPSGTGKSTITRALCADHDVARKYATPAIEVSVDLSVTSQVEDFRERVDNKLADSEKSSPGRRPLLLVTMSSVLAQGTQRDNSRRVMSFIRSSFAPSNPLPRPCTIVFEVPESHAAGLIYRHFGLGAEADIAVPDLSPEAAIDLLLVHKGLHYQCEECEQQAPAVAAAAGYWPPLLAVCARSFYEQKNLQPQHDYLEHAFEAFEHLTSEERMYQTFGEQVGYLPKQARDLLKATGVLLPKPFTFSPDLIKEISGMSKEATGQGLRTLFDREFIERANYAGQADSNPEPRYTVHPFFWSFLEQQEKELNAQRGAAGRKMKKLRSAAFAWLDQEVDEIVEGDLGYRGWFELEKPERQSLIANWIYQLARLDDRRRAAEELARIFLKAYWWWGCYLPFSFCDLLVELGGKAVDWSSPPVGDDLMVIADAIQKLNKWYPRAGYFDNPPAAEKARMDWRKTEKALHDIADQLNIPIEDDDATTLSEAGAGGTQPAIRQLKARREIAMFLHAFLADCQLCFFGEKAIGDAALREVERHSETALALAEELADDFNMPWIGAELSDAELDAAKERRRSPTASGRTEAVGLEEARARATKARTRAEEALRLARARDRADPDFENMSFCERLLGDIDWFEGSKDAAAQHYARAIHYAHCFEVWPDDHPDVYTWTFEREQRWRVSAPLLELADAGGDQTGLRTVCGHIAAFLGADPGTAFRHVSEAAAASGERQPGFAVNGLFAPYVLPPDSELTRGEGPDRTLIDKFRSEAIKMIRSTELRHPDPEDLVRLPDGSDPS